MKIMNKLQNRKEALKKNNKGFSLVELIIVIAIMAILVGIVGTQVIPYIDKSRNSKDIQVLSGLCTDGMTAYSSNVADLDKDGYVIEITASSVKAYEATVSGSTFTKTATESTKLADAFTELNKCSKITDLKLESKAGKDVTTVTIECSSITPDMIKVSTTLKTGSKATNFEPITSK